ncbi:MAG: class II aldolase/adducin family protein [Mogibacterium sp.]|nr:class II aldolase/adducin family protein [Mogibacterium sp.]
MNFNEGVTTLVNGAKAFKDRYRVPFGQLALRFDNDSFLMSDENLRLSRISESDVKLYDIKTGDIGKIFRARPDIGALAFICTEEIVEFSSRGKALVPCLDDLAQIIGAKVPVVRGGTAGDILTAVSDIGGCMIQGAGAVGTGRNIQEAVAAAQIIQKGCECEIFGEKLGGVKHLPANVVEELRKDFINSYSIVNSDSFVNYVGHDDEEFKLRNELIETGKQMSRDSLVHGCWGNLSVLLDEKNMLISPSGMDYFNIRIEDVVRVDLDTLEYGDQRKPSSEAYLHALMYKKLPDCKAIVHTHSNACAILAASHASFLIEDEALHNLIGDYLNVEYAMSGSEELAEKAIEVLRKTHAVSLANHGALFYGPSLDVVLAIANAVESRAANLTGYNRKMPIPEEE